MKRNLLSILPFAFLLLCACGEEKEEDPRPAKTALITGKNWNITHLSATKNGVNYPGFNQNNLSACNLDDLLIFYPDLTYVNDEGPTKCNAAAPQIQQKGTWELLNNGTQIEVKLNNQTETQDIEKLTATELTLTRSETRSDGNYRFTYHYSAK
jgi:TusA-related sulfurtransferase